MNLRVVRFLIILLSLVIPSLQICADDIPIGSRPYLGQEPPGIQPEVFAPGIISTGAI
jgi:hypothetical protein